MNEFEEEYRRQLKKLTELTEEVIKLGEMTGQDLDDPEFRNIVNGLDMLKSEPMIKQANIDDLFTLAASNALLETLVGELKNELRFVQPKIVISVDLDEEGKLIEDGMSFEEFLLKGFLEAGVFGDEFKQAELRQAGRKEPKKKTEIKPPKMDEEKYDFISDDGFYKITMKKKDQSNEDGSSRKGKPRVEASSEDIFKDEKRYSFESDKVSMDRILKTPKSSNSNGSDENDNDKDL